MVNIDKLKGKIVENRMCVQDLGDAIGTNSSTVYRKIKKNGGDFTVREIDAIAELLKLTESEVVTIFFSQFVARNAKQGGELG